MDELTLPEQIAIWDRRALDAAAHPATPDQQLVDRVRLIPAKLRRALDLGCGHGRHLLLLASMGWRITGLDWSPTALEHAKRRLEAAGRYGSIVKADFRNLPESAPAFHLIVATRVLNHGRLADFKRAMHEIKRVLYVGGTAIISVPTTISGPPASGGTWVEAGTCIMSSGSETGLPHHFFTEDEVQACTPQFRQVTIDRVAEPFPEGYKLLHDQQLNEWFWITLTA